MSSEDLAEQLHYLSLQEISRRIAAREISSLEVTKHMLDRIAAIDGRLESYATVMAAEALAAARRADDEIGAGRYSGPLHGVPVAVKDLCCTRGTRTMGGTAVLANFIPDEDATVVQKLAAAGAVLLGKLNLSEGAMAGYARGFGNPVNPWDAAHWAGVSSSGAGVAVAAGLCFAAIGTDTGGSIRLPASANGIVGLKPTFGRISCHGVLPLAESMDHVGPMARSVADVAVMFDALAGFDPLDPDSLRSPPPDLCAALGQDARGLRIGLDRDYAFSDVVPGQVAAIEAALAVLGELGVQIVDVRLPDMSGVMDAWYQLCAAGAAQAHRQNFPSRAGEYGAYFREFLQFGAAMTDAQVAEANAYRLDLRTRLDALLADVDAVACPAGGAPALLLAREDLYGSVEEVTTAFLIATCPNKPGSLFTAPMSLAGVPAICLPCGFSDEGLPYSIQFFARRDGEANLCRIAHAYEQASGWHKRHPDL